MHKGSLNQALQNFEGAGRGDPKFVEGAHQRGAAHARLAQVRRREGAFSKALEIAPKNYDATIGLGVAQRGLNDLDGAEASYKKAQGLDGGRGDAYFNLGVLYKDFRATKQSDMKASINMYNQAKEFFNQFLGKQGSQADKEEAKDNIKDCDKVTKQLQNFITQQANNPPPPAPAPAPDAKAGDAKGGDAKAPDAKAPPKK
jgi:tetratricopeptide (TPR) repeat protein